MRSVNSKKLLKITREERSCENQSQSIIRIQLVNRCGIVMEIQYILKESELLIASKSTIGVGILDQTSLNENQEHKI